MHTRQHVYRKGFALPTVLIASIVLLSILAVSVSATSAIRTTLKNQYYAQMAQVAGEAGVAYAKACLAANGNVPLWTDAKPLKPNTDCSGNELLGSVGSAGCPDDRCSVVINGNARSSFSVGLPTLDSQGKAVTIPYTGYTDILRTSNGSVWRTISQPSVQAAVVPDLCSGAAASDIGWGNAVRSATQDALPGASAAQSISLSATETYAGARYFRRDFSVKIAGTYNLSVLTPSSKDVAEVYVGSTKVATSSGSLASGSIALGTGCQTIFVKYTNVTVDARLTRFTASLTKSDASAPLVTTDSSWRASSGNAVHYSSPKYYAAPGLWNKVAPVTNVGWADNLAARGITTNVSVSTGYAYFRDDRIINVTTPTEISTGFACTNTCDLFIDGEYVANGQSSSVSYFSSTLQPGDHAFGIRLKNGGSNYFYLTAFRASDNAILTQSDYNWSTTDSWTTSQDYFSYDRTYNPLPAVRKNATVSALIVGGGGGGGNRMGGGGGGGGVVYTAAYKVYDSVSVVVGAGGAGTPAGAGTARGTDGSNSSLGTLIAFGGGGGGSDYSVNTKPPASGGSGGGSPGCNSPFTATGIIGQGNNGGGGGACYYPGGGGGAGGPGSINPGTGGIGVANAILGTSYYWGGGGGGSGYTGIGGNGGNGGGGGGAIGVTTGGAGLNAGSAGGGGATNVTANRPGGDAGANTGGGGGGGSQSSATNAGGNGGSGIVVISYPTGSLTATGGTITTSGGNTIHKFLLSGTFTIVSVP